MERIERASGSVMMSANEVATHLLTTCPSLEHFEAFMFGSTVTGVGVDIDILIVGPGGSLLSEVKRELRSAGEALPLHVLCMLPSEALHTQFVAREKCVPLSHLAMASLSMDRRRIGKQSRAEGNDEDKAARCGQNTTRAVALDQKL